ncbi:hypothetical protein [Enterobacter hormaechei]|uniref:hypothetical protein n=1 Tax=Enterobacter hormaechei TaxID=158836 RepID=UPI001D0FB831|nr:hypothetical protein [Enterobacter hormaechei]UDV37824.1 hypothetical protein LJU43_00035 [Enterobacter hormaechei]
MKSVPAICSLWWTRQALASADTEIFLRTGGGGYHAVDDGQQFGLTSLEPAVFIDASRDEFDPRMDDYLVWRISFTHRQPLVRIRLRR